MFLCLCILDMSIARLRYHYMLSGTLSPIKREISMDMYNYHDSVPVELKGCDAFDRQTGIFIRNCSLSACEQNAFLLSEKRQGILEAVRSSHPTSRVVGELFDVVRGLDQKEKIQRLFSRKSCEGIIQSSDKTNALMDLVAIITFMISLYVLWWTLIRHFSRVKVD